MTKLQWRRTGFIPLFVIMGIMFCLSSTALAANFVVIVNKSVTENSLSKAELQAIFLGEKVKWENKRYIKVAILESGAAYKDFLQTIVGKTASQFDQHWQRMASTGRATLPPYFTEVQQLIEYVAKQPNAIGVVPPGQENGSTKTLAIK
jgi:ABC-type phosphate transport system substrate-binding protein